MSECPVMSGRVNMHQIARLAGVSTGTVSHVLNGTARVRDELKRRVLNAVALLGYQPNQLARGLRRNATNIIGMVIPDITNPFFPAVVRGVEDVAAEARYRLVLCNTDNDAAKEAASIGGLRSFSPAGFLVIPSPGSTLAQTAGPAFPPVICLDRRPARWSGDSVLVDNEQGAHNSALQVIELGHCRGGVITGPLRIDIARARLRGIRRAFAAAGHPIEPAYIVSGQFDHASGYECARRLLGLPRPPTAIFASNDMMATGALMAIRAAGCKCPADVSLVGFDDLEFAELTDPALTTVHQPGYELGATAARLLLERIAGETKPAQRVVIATELRIRGSVAPPRERAQ